MSWPEDYLSVRMLKMDEIFKNQIFATHAVAAAGSVTLSTALTYPLDTIKTLIQVLYLAIVDLFCYGSISV